MSTRLDEAVGNTKKTVGDLTGNERLEREGQAEATRAKAQRQTEGAIDKTVGKAQETWGEFIDDPEAEAKGKVRQLEGDAKRAG